MSEKRVVDFDLFKRQLFFAYKKAYLDVLEKFKITKAKLSFSDFLILFCEGKIDPRPR